MAPAEFSCGGGLCQSLLKTLSWDVLSGRIAAGTNAEEQTYLELKKHNYVWTHNRVKTPHMSKALQEDTC